MPHRESDSKAAWDAIVIGLGVMGGAVLHRLAERGAKVLGLERFDIPHALGSSHGGTRVIRKAYFEDARYVPLLHRAWTAWEAMEAAANERLIVRTGGLHFGPEGHPDLVATIAAAKDHGLPHELLDAPAIAARFSTIIPGPRDVGVLEDDAGVLFADRAVQCQVALAARAGASVRARERVTAIRREGSLIEVHIERAIYRAAKVVLALGPWWSTALEAFGLPAVAPLQVERQVQLWFGGRDPAAFRVGRFPIFMRFGDEGLFYGLPDAGHITGPPGVKVCAHHGGDDVHPETIDRELREADEHAVRDFLARHLPSANGALLGARVCMYTNTPDRDFLVGPHPDDARVLVAAGFSGHGFKFAPVIGDILADFALAGSSALAAQTGGLFDPGRFR